MGKCNYIDETEEILGFLIAALVFILTGIMSFIFYINTLNINSTLISGIVTFVVLIIIVIVFIEYVDENE